MRDAIATGDGAPGLSVEHNNSRKLDNLARTRSKRLAGMHAGLVGPSREAYMVRSLDLRTEVIAERTERAAFMVPAEIQPRAGAKARSRRRSMAR